MWESRRTRIEQIGLLLKLVGTHYITDNSIISLNFNNK